MHLFGLTGGLASGKSTVARRLRTRGVPVIDADALAREVVLPGTSGLEAVVAALGPDARAPDGSLDRAAVARMVFGDDAKRRALNAIVHPRIAALTVERSEALAAAGEPLACYEAALIVENGMAEAFRPLVVVAAPPEVQIARAMARDGVTEAEARGRLAAQRPLADKVAVADHVIDNTGTLADLERKTDEILATICATFGVDATRYAASGGS